MTEEMKPLIYAASEGPLSTAQAKLAFDILFEGKAAPSQVGGLLMAMRARGESVSEYSAAAAAMRSRCISVKAPLGSIDIVGTGGDGVGTLNISTASAFVVAGAGINVAKHGNKNLSSKSGAADALTALGINVMVDSSVVEAEIKHAGIGFMMAPMHHPATRHVMPIRQELGCKTIFNILGPLTNPAGVKRQLSGAFAPDLLFPMAETLDTLGCEKAWLVHGSDGTDELTIVGSSSVVELVDGKISSFEIHPEDAGLPTHKLSEILGGSPDENAAELKGLLEGKKNAYRDAVLLNSAAALIICSGMSLSSRCISSARGATISSANREKVSRTNSFSSPNPECNRPTFPSAISEPSIETLFGPLFKKAALALGLFSMTVSVSNSTPTSRQTVFNRPMTV